MRVLAVFCCFFFSSRRRHTRYIGDWSSDVCSSDLTTAAGRIYRELSDPNHFSHFVLDAFRERKTRVVTSPDLDDQMIALESEGPQFVLPNVLPHLGTSRAINLNGALDVMNHDPLCSIDPVSPEISKGNGWIFLCRILHYLNRQMAGPVINEIAKRVVSKLLDHRPVGVVGFKGDYSPSPHNRRRRLGPKCLT